MMRYADGAEIRAGDRVALHHRTYRGTVRHVIVSVADADAWAVKEAGVMIDTSFGGLVFYPEQSLNAEEAELLTRAVE